MNKALVIGIVTIMLVGLILTGPIYAHYRSHHWDEDEVKVDTKKIDNGIQITITSDNTEMVKDLQQDKRWSEKALSYGDYLDDDERGRDSEYDHHHMHW
ncbi:MAG: hypothetical protein ABH868_00180 [bacterium]